MNISDDAPDALSAWEEYQPVFKKAFKVKRPKKIRREGEPKKNVSAFFLYSANMREEVKRNNPELGQTDIARKLGEMWKVVDEQTKENYKNQEKILREKYEADKARFIAEFGEAPRAVAVEKPVSKPKKIRTKKAADAPAGPRTTYTCFCTDERQNLATEGVTDKSEIKAQLSTRWAEFKKGLNPDDVQRMQEYKAIVEDDKARYTTEKAAYDASHPVINNAELEAALDAALEAESEPESEEPKPVKKSTSRPVMTLSKVNASPPARPKPVAKVAPKAKPVAAKTITGVPPHLDVFRQVLSALEEAGVESISRKLIKNEMKKHAITLESKEIQQLIDYEQRVHA